MPSRSTQSPPRATVSRRRLIAAPRSAAIAVAIGLATVLLAACAQDSPSPSPSSVSPASPTASSPTPTPAAPTPATPSPTATQLGPEADLTGLAVADPVLAHRIPLAVMLDDSRAARPQSGFNAASIVYQAPADGYETRYLLLFQEGETESIGPVRSARFYLVQWSSEVQAAIAHYGGDRRTRTYIEAAPVPFTSVDGLGRGNPAYRRIKSRVAPHNAYTSTAKLRAVAMRLGAASDLPADVHRRPFVEPSPVESRAASQRVTIPYRTNVITYRYDRATNLYRRSVDGKAQIDPADKARVTTTNIVVLFQKFRIDTKIEPGHSRPDITTLGSGEALVLREGRVVEATWRKDDDASPTLLLDAAGAEIPLVRGRTFIQVVPPRTKVVVGD